MATQQTSFWIARPTWSDLGRALSQYAGSTAGLVLLAAAAVTEALRGVAGARAPRGASGAAGDAETPGLLLAL